MLVAIRRNGRRYLFAEPLSAARTLDDDNMEKIVRSRARASFKLRARGGSAKAA
jgi:hypothetical protein